jgi:hypothetical protein
MFAAIVGIIILFVESIAKHINENKADNDH